MRQAKDRSLGMEPPIPRREFLQGVSVAVGAALLAGHTSPLQALGRAQGAGRSYPLALTGLRGTHDGS
jgi:hypothetical protein